MAKHRKTNVRKIVTEITFIRQGDSNGPEKLAQRFFRFLDGKEDKVDSDILKYLLDDKNVRTHLSAYQRGLANCYCGGKSFEVRPERIVFLIEQILKKESKTLSKFALIKRDFEQALTIGNYSEANLYLDRIQELFGYSLWLLNSRILACAKKSRSELIYKFIDCSEVSKNSVLKEKLIRMFSYYLSDEAATETQKVFLNEVLELVDGNARSLASIQALDYLPFPSYPEMLPNHSIYFLQSYSLIDLYLRMEKIGLINFVNRELDKDFVPYLASLADTALEIRNSNFSVSKSFELIQYLYQEGRYLDLVNEIKANPDSRGIALSNIVAKSLLYCNKPVAYLQFEGLFFETISYLYDIYGLKNLSSSCQGLENLISDYQWCNLSYHIQISYSKSLVFSFKAEDLKKISALAKFFGHETTNLSKFIGHASPMTVAEGGNLSESLKKKKSIISYVKSGNVSFDELNEYFHEYGKINPIRKDLVELKSTVLIELKAYKELLNFASGVLVENQAFKYCFPFQLMSDLILNPQLTSVDTVIIAHAYDTAKEKGCQGLLNEAYEDYMLSVSEELPSNLIQSLSVLDNKHIHLFLNILKPEIIDYLAVFDSSLELFYERIRLLLHLDSKVDSKIELIDSEIDLSIKQLIVEMGTAQFRNSKIKVNLDALKAELIPVIDELLPRYFQFPKESLSLKELPKEYSSLLDEDDQLLSAELESRTQIAAKITSRTYIEYLTNHKYGLDKSLSSEVRHTFFPNSVFSVFSKYSLLMDLDERSVKAGSVYWNDFYHMVNKDIRKKLDEALTQFTKGLSERVKEAEEWMKVSISASHRERMFTQEISIDDIEFVMSSIEGNCTAGALVDALLDIISKRTSEQFVSLREKLNSEFIKSTNESIEKLKRDVDGARRGAALTHFYESLNKAADELKSSIEAISQWLAIRKSTDLVSMSFSEILTIAKNCFQQSYLQGMNINERIRCQEEINGDHVAPLVSVLLNAFSNAISYRLEGAPLNVEFYSTRNGGYILNLTNEVKPETLAALKNGGLERIHGMLVSGVDDSLLSGEGGTGLYKSKFELAQASERFCMGVSLGPEDEFKVEVCYE